MYISFAAFGMKCYTCSSDTSMDDCDKNRKETVCGSSYDRCVSMTMEYTVGGSDFKSYGKRCATKAMCDRASSMQKKCKDIGRTCKIDCCDGDLCNVGGAPTEG